MAADAETQLQTVQVTMARIEGKLDATLKSHENDLARLAAKQHDLSSSQADDRAAIATIVAMQSAHEERIKDLEESRDQQLPSAAQGTGIVAGAVAIVLGIWNAFENQ